MLERLRAFARPYLKSIAVAVAGAASTLAARYGFDLTETQQGVIFTAVLTAMCWLVPNKKES